MYNSIIDNDEVMSILRSDKENYEANCYILKAVSKEPYSKQLQIAKGLILNDKETKSRKNKEEYEANKTNRQEKARNRGEELTQCILCNMKMKKNVLQRHINNRRVCISKQEELYGLLPVVNCSLCKLKVRECELDRHENSRKCRERQGLLSKLRDDDY